MTGLLSKKGRIKRIGLVAGLLGGLLLLNLGPDAGAASQCNPNHNRNRPCGATAVMGTLRVTASPWRERIVAGSTARYTLRIRRRRFAAAVGFQLVGRYPRGLSVRFSGRSTRSSRVRLVIRTNSRLAPRRYRLKVRARSGRVTRTLTLILTIVRRPPGATAAGGPGTGGTSGTAGGGSGSAVVADPASYSIGGNAAGPLEPGIAQPLDLQIANSNSTPLTVSDLSVAIQAIQAPNASATLPCSTADFAVQQYSGPLPLVVPASSTSTLAGLGVAPAAQPQISLLDLPSDQDGCQGASVTLSYSANATTG